MHRLFALALLAIPQAPASAPVAGHPAVAPADLEAAKLITRDELKRDLTFLASDELQGRATPSPGQAKAAEFLAKRFAELKLKPFGDGGDYMQTLNEPRGDRVFNVVGVLPGSDPAQKAIVFSAHYDHIGVSGPANAPDRIHNGADDDASGTVVVLALAKAYAARAPKPKRTLVFACFTGEEIGGLGSKAYVKAPAIPLDRTLCDVNLEMLGRTFDVGPKRAWVTGYDVTTLGAILAKGAKGAGVEVFADPYPQQQFYLRSDNASFVMKGVMGHSISAGSTHPDYHTPKDEADRIEYENLEALARGIYLGSSLIASGAETPKLTGDSLMPRPPDRKKK